MLFVVILIYYLRFAEARKQNRVAELRRKIATRYLYALSAFFILFSVVLGLAGNEFPEEMRVLKWEAVIMPLTAVMITPIFVTAVFKVSKPLAIIFPVISVILMISYIPFSTGADINQTVEILIFGVISFFSIGVITIIAGFLAIFFLMILIDLLSAPVVYVI